MAKAPAFLRPLVRYADFKGRSRRAEFWSFYLLLWVVYGCVYGLLLQPFLPLLQGQPLKPDPGMILQFFMAAVIGTIFGLALLIPTLAVQVRRLHDSNRTGWWVALPFAASTIGQSVAYLFRAEDITRASLEVGTTISATPPGSFNLLTIFQAEWPLYQIILPYIAVTSGLAALTMLVFYLWPGSKGDNRFGPNPRNG